MNTAFRCTSVGARPGIQGAWVLRQKNDMANKGKALTLTFSTTEK